MEKERKDKTMRELLEWLLMNVDLISVGSDIAGLCDLINNGYMPETEYAYNFSELINGEDARVLNQYVRDRLNDGKELRDYYWPPFEADVRREWIEQEIAAFDALEELEKSITMLEETLKNVNNANANLDLAMLEFLVNLIILGISFIFIFKLIKTMNM